jgi:hypothetical protein
MKTITFKIESEDGEFLFDIQLSNESFKQIKHIILRKLEQAIETLLLDKFEKI